MRVDEYHSFLVFGDSGTGKTTLWGSILDAIDRDVLVILCSGGRDPGELKSLNTPEQRKRIQSVVLESPSEMDDIGQWLATDGNDKFGAVVLDHITGFQDLKLMKYKGLDAIPQQKHFGIATQLDWGDIGAQVKEHLVHLLSVPNMHRIIVAQERLTMPKEDVPAELRDVIIPKIGAALTPSIANWIHTACDYNLQTFLRPKMERTVTPVGKKGTPGYKETVSEKRAQKDGQDEVEFCVRTARHDIVLTKFRIPKGRELPGCIPDPSFPKILKLINGG